ncbi:hypothetical protein [Neomoorella thermoacetica]|uniref:hypothetical protein n=1 Tax=Neomoorella thermoacetica TaxID=1525 RepID=UPI00091E91E2|nr:hypothetical protein [Moorella thermoacetica]OIQ58996.1 hypothetical protein MTIN_25630 [Moorella thermoacetica]
MTKQIRHIAATLILLLLMYLILSQNLYNLPSILSRLFVFAILALIILSLYLSTELTLITIPFLIYFYRHSFIFLTNVSETVSLAQHYEAGKIFYLNAHSYFFSLPYLIYIVHKLMNLNYIHSKNVLMFFILLLISCMGVYFYRNFQDNDKGFVKIASAALISFSFTISPGLGYREMGTLLFILAMIYWLKHSNGGTKDIIGFIILIIGASIGSPISCLIIIFVFGINWILTRKVNPYVIISLSWMIYAGFLYLTYLRSYIYSAWNGIYEFIDSLLNFRFEDRIIPFARTIVWLPIDTFFLSISYIASLMLVILCLFCYIKFIKNHQNLIPKALFLSAIILLLIGTGTYVGASVMPEKTFSDIRTIAISFLFVILPLLFIVIFPEVKGKLTSVLVILFILASSRLFFDVYPKSIQDPINVLEDIRITGENTIKTSYFIKDKVITPNNNHVFSDYKIGLLLGALLFNSNFPTYSLYPDRSIISYNRMGIKFDSIYLKKDTYNKLITITDKSDLFYDNGSDIILQYKKTLNEIK